VVYIIRCRSACLDKGFFESFLLSSAQTTGSSGGNETDLLTSRGISSDGRWVTNVLVVTSSVRMISGIHSHTSNSGPSVSLSLVLVIGNTGLQQRLVDSSSSSNEANRSSAGRVDGLLGTRWQTDSASFSIITVGNDGGVVTRAAGQGSSVSSLGLNVADDGTLRHHRQGQNVSGGQLSFLSSVDKLTAVHTLSSNEKFLVFSIFVRVSEGNSGQRSTSSRIVDDVGYESSDVTISLSEIETSMLGRTDSVFGVSSEDCSSSLSLSSNNTTHL